MDPENWTSGIGPVQPKCNQTGAAKLLQPDQRNWTCLCQSGCTNLVASVWLHQIGCVSLVALVKLVQLHQSSRSGWHNTNKVAASGTNPLNGSHS